MAPWSVGAESNGMVCPAQFSFVFGMTIQGTQLLFTMGKLALVSILAVTILLEGPAQFSLVTRRIDIALVCLVVDHVLLVLDSASLVSAHWLADGAVQLLAIVHRGRGHRAPERRDRGRRGAGATHTRAATVEAVPGVVRLHTACRADAACPASKLLVILLGELLLLLVVVMETLLWDLLVIMMNKVVGHSSDFTRRLYVHDSGPRHVTVDSVLLNKKQQNLAMTSGQNNTRNNEALSKSSQTCATIEKARENAQHFQYGCNRLLVHMAKAKHFHFSSK